LSRWWPGQVGIQPLAWPAKVVLPGMWPLSGAASDEHGAAHVAAPFASRTLALVLLEKQLGQDLIHVGDLALALREPPNVKTGGRNVIPARHARRSGQPMVNRLTPPPGGLRGPRD
jgi:hypothetical protein